MCYKLCLIALSALMLCVVCVHSAAVDQFQLVVEQQAQDAAAAADVDVPEACHQPKETGRCFALFYRFAYNLDTQACEEFVYGGCAGNSNNFESKEQCEQACRSRSATATELRIEATTEQAQKVAETTVSSSSSI